MTLETLKQYTQGYKTKIAVVVLVVLAGLKSLGYIDAETTKILALVAEALLGYGIYDKLQRNMKK